MVLTMTGLHTEESECICTCGFWNRGIWSRGNRYFVAILINWQSILTSLISENAYFVFIRCGTLATWCQRHNHKHTSYRGFIPFIIRFKNLRHLLEYSSQDIFLYIECISHFLWILLPTGQWKNDCIKGAWSTAKRNPLILGLCDWW